MNIYQKELMHAWANKTPEGKKREKLYNKKYYAENKERWVINAERRKASRRSFSPISGISSNSRYTAETPSKPSSTFNSKSVIPTFDDYRRLAREVKDSVSRVVNTADRFFKKIGKILETPVEVTKYASKDVFTVLKKNFSLFVNEVKNSFK